MSPDPNKVVRPSAGLAVQCPYCGAKRGKPCEDISTRKPVEGVHRDRFYRGLELESP